MLVLAWGFGEAVQTEPWVKTESWVIGSKRRCCELVVEGLAHKEVGRKKGCSRLKVGGLRQRLGCILKDGPLKYVGLAWCEFMS